jgi:hypothetical protein
VLEREAEEKKGGATEEQQVETIEARPVHGLKVSWFWM